MSTATRGDEMREVAVRTPDRPARFPTGTGTIRIHDGHRVVDEDMALIVHDLESPLASIAQETAVLDDWLARGDRQRAARCVARIQDNVWYLERLAHDLLDVCASSTGKLVLSRAAADLRTLLERVIDRVASPARARVHLEAPTTALVWLDELRIQRVVANLLDHALRYAPSETTVVVQLATTPTRAVVSVIDAGAGVARADVAEVFTRKRRGSNIAGRAGLFASKQIVEAHGGTIGLERLPGVGSRAFFELLR